jgi:hypothetical protein
MRFSAMQRFPADLPSDMLAGHHNTMRLTSITHASAPRAALCLLAAFALALPSVTEAAVFAPPPGTPTTTAPTTPATPTTPAATTPATPAPPTTPAPGATPKATSKTHHGATAPKPATPAPTQTAPAAPVRTTTATSAAESSSNGNTALILAFVAAIALLVGIAFVILRDAHSVAPVGDGPSGGSTRDPAARMRKRRRKAKAARQQRKRNR